MLTAAVSVWAATLFLVVKMKKINKLTLCSMLAALAVVVMLIAYFPYLTYGIPMAAGVFIMIAVIEAGKGWGMLTYAVSAALCLLERWNCKRVFGVVSVCGSRRIYGI